MGYAGVNYSKRRKTDLPTFSYRRPYEGVSASFQASRSTTRMARRPGKGQSVSTRRQYSKKYSRIAHQKPTVSTLCETRITRLQGIKQEVPDNDTEVANYPGFFPIGKGISSSALSQFSLPVYIADLTRFPNEAAGTFSFYQLRLGDAGNVSFNERPTQIADGSTGTNATWNTERTNHVDAQPMATTMQHLWYDIRLKLYGARRQSVTYDIMLVRFTDECLIPDNTPNNSEDALTRTSFWQSIARAQVVNTILPQTAGWNEGMRVLRQRRFNLEASSADDLDRVPESVDFKWLVRDSRILRYTQNNKTFSTDVAVDNVGWLVESAEVTSVLNDPHRLTSRTFLMIRATDMTVTRNLNDDMDDTPSFDMCIRRKTRLFPPT